MKKRRWPSLLLALLAILGIIVAACSSGQAENTSQEAFLQNQDQNKGYLRLSINPEIMIEYDQNGIVTDVFGMNEAGVKITNEYQSYQGKPSDLVLEELIQVIYDHGYFIDNETKQVRQIVLELEPGSIKPKQDFLQDMSTRVEEKIGQLDFDDLITQEDLISLDDAKKIALEETEIKAEDAKFEENDYKFDLKDDTKAEDIVYKLVFTANNKKYRVNVNAVSGKVTDKKVEDIKQNSNQSNDTSGNNSHQSNNQNNKQAPAQASQQAPKTQAPRTQTPAPKPAPRYYYDDDWDDDDDDWDDDWDDDDDDDD